MAITDLFDTICCCSCGLCCSKNVLCERCEVSTLEANGLSVDHVKDIRGLSKVFQGNGKFSSSPLYYKLIELQKQHK